MRCHLRALAAVPAAMLAAILVACSPASTAPTAPAGTAAPASQPTAPAAAPTSGGAAVAPAGASEFGDDSLISAAKSEGQVVVYTAQAVEDSQALADAFMKQFPQIKVEIVRKGGGELNELIQTEFSAGKLRADVIEHSDPGLLLKLDNDLGLLADYKSPSDAHYPPEFKVGKMYPPYLLLHGFAYNTRLVPADKAPKSWQDFLDPAFNGRRTQVAATAGGCAWALVLFQGSVLGKDYWQKEAATNPSISSSNAEMIQRLARGETMVSTMLDTVARGVIRTGSPVAMVYPTEGVPPCQYGSGVVGKAAHPNAGRLWLNWTLSREGQSVWVNDRQGFSLRDDMPSPPGTPDRSQVHVWAWSMDDYTQKHDEWIKEWSQIFNFTP